MRKKKRWWRTLETKDRITISISLAALFISGLTAYFSFFRQYDEVSVVVEQHPILELYSKEKVAIYGDSVLAFMNTGNRPAAIIDVTVVANQNQDEDSLGSGPCQLGTDRFATTFEPLVLKPGDLVLKTIKLKPYANAEVRQGMILFPATGKPESDKDAPIGYIAEQVDLCFYFRLVTPSDRFLNTYVHLGEMTASKPAHMTILKFGGTERPIRLVQNSTTILADWTLVLEKWWRLLKNESESPEEEREFKKFWWWRGGSNV